MTNTSGSGGVDGGYQTSPQHFIIEHARLYPNVKTPEKWDGSFNFIDDIQKIEIREGLTQRAIIVNISCKDVSNILELCKISGDEKIELKLVQNMKEEGKKVIDLELYISDIINYTKPALTSQSFTIQAVPKPAYLNQFFTIQRSFSDSISKSITGLCRDIEIEEDMRDIESGGGISKGIYPNLKPLSAIKWLCRSALEGGPYFFWNTIQDGKPIWKFKSYDILLEQEPIETFNNHPYYVKDKGTEYEKQIRKIQKISSRLGLSKYNSAPTGAFSSTQTNVDIATKEVKKKVYSYNIEDEERINKFAPISKEHDKLLLDKQDGSREFYTSSNSLAFGDRENYHGMEYENLQKTNSRLANLDFMSHDLTLMGNPDLSAGQMINLKLWKNLDPSTEADGVGEDDLYMGGKYIITQLTHIFESKKYSVELKVSKDSSAIDFDKEITI
jgi:hypothetical protein